MLSESLVVPDTIPAVGMASAVVSPIRVGTNAYLGKPAIFSSGLTSLSEYTKRVFFDLSFLVFFFGFVVGWRSWCSFCRWCRLCARWRDMSHVHLLQLERIDMRSTKARSLGETRGGWETGSGWQTTRPGESGGLWRVVLGLLRLGLRGKRRGSGSVGLARMRRISRRSELRWPGREILVHWTGSLLVWRISPVRLRI